MSLDALRLHPVHAVAGIGNLKKIADEEAVRLTNSTGRTAALLKSQMKMELYEEREQTPDDGNQCTTVFDPNPYGDLCRLPGIHGGT